MDDFKAQFSGDIVTPNHPDYEQAISRWANNAIRRAAIVAFVKVTEDVTLAIKYARDNSLRLAVRGGGHNPSGASSSEGGLVIDLSKYLTGVEIDVEKKLAYVQGGAVWKSVDEAALKLGLAAVGGTVDHTGVGGLSLGGGYGWLSGEYGLVIDNIAQVKIVTADGQTLVANDTENSDLFWGIRGGGSNFGVVTEFVYKLHDQRRTVFGGRIIFSVDKCQKIGEYLDSWWPTAQPHEALLVGLTQVPGKSAPAILVLVFYNGSEEEGREHFKDLIGIGPLLDHAKDIPYENMNTLINPSVEKGSNFYFKGALLSKKPSDDINPQKIQRLVETVPYPDFTFMNMHEYWPQHKINSVPADATPYRRNLPGHAMIGLRWEEHSPEKQKQAREIAHKVAEMYVEGEGYGNYHSDSSEIGVGPSERARALFGDNYPRLQALKKKYDPDVIFNQWYTVSPA